MTTKNPAGQAENAMRIAKILVTIFLVFAGWFVVGHRARQASEIKQEIAIAKLQAESKANDEQMQRLDDDFDDWLAFFMQD